MMFRPKANNRVEVNMVELLLCNFSASIGGQSKFQTFGD